MEKIISWVEIPTTDFQRAVNFYQDILNLKVAIFEGEKEKMACFPGGEGAIVYAPDFKPSKNGVLVSFYVKVDMDNTLNKIKSRGGSVVQPKTKIESKDRGYFSIFTDCEGNKVGLHSTR